ncbi:MAG TPA: antibiotic biosynthesis monooxygenase [Chitinophagaceae bacterium]|nr:antibiotic biosynthesis monooxygenase [Chitinophagaceae bacterium]
MFIRLTFFDFQLQYLNEVKKIFNDEVVPVVKTQKGNLGIWLLEPTSPMEQFISLTEWTSEEDAEAYQTSGVYKQLVDILKDKYRTRPVLKTYNVASRVAAVL